MPKNKNKQFILFLIHHPILHLSYHSPGLICHVIIHLMREFYSLPHFHIHHEQIYPHTFLRLDNNFSLLMDFEAIIEMSNPKAQLSVLIYWLTWSRLVAQAGVHHQWTEHQLRHHHTRPRRNHTHRLLQDPEALHVEGLRVLWWVVDGILWFYFIFIFISLICVKWKVLKVITLVMPQTSKLTMPFFNFFFCQLISFFSYTIFS